MAIAGSRAAQNWRCELSDQTESGRILWRVLQGNTSLRRFDQEGTVPPHCHESAQPSFAPANLRGGGRLQAHLRRRTPVPIHAQDHLCQLAASKCLGRQHRKCPNP
jgi:hypothetical protein